MRQPGIEPGSTAWKAAMLTTIPLTQQSTLRRDEKKFLKNFSTHISSRWRHPMSLAEALVLYNLIFVQPIIPEVELV